MKQLTYIFLLILSGSSCFGQHNPLVSHYMINSLPLNPAFSGSRDALSVSLNYRKQWVNFDQSPSTGTLSIHTPGKKSNLGFGLLLINDELGISRQTGAMGNIAYHLKTTRGKLNFGLAGGFFNYKNNWSEIETTEGNDDVFNIGDQSHWGVNFSAGLYYYERNFYASLSSPFMLNNQFKDKPPIETERYKSPSSFNIFLNTGYRIELKKPIDIIPSIMLKYVNYSPMQIDLNCLVEYNRKISAGVSFRPNDAVIGILKYQINSMLLLGYGMDFTLNEIREYSQGSHEITLQLDLIEKTRSKSVKFF